MKINPQERWRRADGKEVLILRLARSSDRHVTDGLYYYDRFTGICTSATMKDNATLRLVEQVK